MTLSIESELMSTFAQRLNESDKLDTDLVAAVEEALRRPRPPKADELVEIISEHTGEAIV
jgi:hypothetical protein